MLGEHRKTDRSRVVDLVRQLRVEIAERIVRQTGQMDNSIEAVEVGEIHVAHILLDGGYSWNAIGEGTAPKKIGIETSDFMPG